MLLIRILPTKEDFGVWALFLTVITILSVLRNGFIRSGLVKELASMEEEEERKVIIGSSFMLNLWFTLIQAALVVLFAQMLGKFWDAPDLTLMLYVYAVGSVFMLSEELADHIAFTAHDNGSAVVVVRPRREAEKLVSVANGRAKVAGYPLTFTLDVK